MTKTFEAQTTAFLTVEAATNDDATNVALAWQTAVSAGAEALAQFEKTNETLSVEFAIDEVEEVKTPDDAS